MAPTLLVRPPASSLAQGIISHIGDQRGSISYKRAQEQWRAYVDVFRTHGWQVVQIEQEDTLPDSVFAEDGIISVDNRNLGDEKSGILILASPGNVAREAEIDGIRATVTQDKHTNRRTLHEIIKSGTLDGGDVLKVPTEGVIYIGESARTNKEGQRQFAQFVEPLGWHVKSVPVVKALHLKSMVTALPDGTVIGYEPLVEDTGAFTRFVAMPEPEGVAVVHLDPEGAAQSPLLMSSSAPRSLNKLRSLGYGVHTVDIDEFEKLEGCVTCLSVRIRKET